MSIEIKLRPELGKYVQEKIQSGDFLNPNEVIESALAITNEQEVFLLENLEELRREIAIGIEAFERGDYAAWSLEEAHATLAKSIAAQNSL